LKVERRGGDICWTDAMIVSVAVNKGASLCTFDLKNFKSLEEMGLQLFQPSTT
jgi:predicted nucleic acid-binding protein